MDEPTIPFATLRFANSYNLPEPTKEFVAHVKAINPDDSSKIRKLRIEIKCEKKSQVESIVKNIKGCNYSLVQYFDPNWVIKSIKAN